jgi:hypothetical protein
METSELDPMDDLPRRPEKPSWLRVFMLLAALAASPFAMGLIRFPESGAPYARLGHDHDELMATRTAQPERTLTILFVGNSLTFYNDLPAMLVNLASSDPGNTTRLQVKAFTVAGVDLGYMRTKTGALDWALANHPDFVVLQEKSLWYRFPGADGMVRQNAQMWDQALAPLSETPVLFQIWSDGDGSQVYTDNRFPTFNSTPAEDARLAAESYDRLAAGLGRQLVPVGRAFQAARETKGAPDVVGPDHHHPSVAGTYLAALVFYRFFTGRSGAEATWRPDGLSAQDAAALVQLNAG